MCYRCIAAFRTPCINENILFLSGVSLDILRACVRVYVCVCGCLTPRGAEWVWVWVWRYRVFRASGLPPPFRSNILGPCKRFPEEIRCLIFFPLYDAGFSIVRSMDQLDLLLLTINLNGKRKCIIRFFFFFFWTWSQTRVSIEILEKEKKRKETERKVPAFYISNKRREDSRFSGSWNDSLRISIRLCLSSLRYEHDPFLNWFWLNEADKSRLLHRSRVEIYQSSTDLWSAISQTRGSTITCVPVCVRACLVVSVCGYWDRYQDEKTGSGRAPVRLWVGVRSMSGPFV